MRVLLVSTYELGHQPLHVAAAAAELRAAGHDLVALDLAVEKWDEDVIEGVDAVAISVPMHTALRLAIETGRRVKELRPRLPVAFYGLYAAVGADRTYGTIAERIICGEYEDQLVEWVASLSTATSSTGVTLEIGRRRFIPPARDLLPPLDRYAHLATPAGHELVGYVEASHGCRHRCAHCPIPAVYDGRYRITGAATVQADIDQLVDAGAGHVTFGDADFLNAPPYAMKVIEEAHDRHPSLTFDITVKVEHILTHRQLWPRLADSGVLFVTSAMETLDETILTRLDKGHTARDASEAVEVVRGAGIDIHPTWLPFTPWTTAASVADIADFVWRHDLAPVTDPVQLSIRLLIPDGSVLLGLEDLGQYLIGYDAQALGYRWRSADPAMEELQRRLSSLAEQGASAGDDSWRILEEMTQVIGKAAGTEIGTNAVPAGATTGRPRMTEPWFC